MMMNYHAPAIVLIAGIRVFKFTYLHVILCFTEENLIRISIVQHRVGHRAPQPRILRILDDYPNRQRLHYLRANAHNLTF